MGDYWIIVNNLGKEPRTFVLLPHEVRQFAHRGEKNGRVIYWLEPAAYDKPDFVDAWHRIDIS